ncbi:MAG TPA: GntR family transcriptional regulator [Candidatus Baltobacteraceae bacterium]|nr:GntR family transcriptional regulator [Candidatus Baltobacteraceae bacterium]
MNRPARAAAATTTEIVPVALARRPRMKESIVDQLRRLILEGKLAPGTVLRQEQLAKQLQVSRTPLREALISLEREGFIVVSPSGAASVVALDARDAREILDVREVIDGLAARLLARRGLDAQTERRLAELEGEMESTAPSDKHRYLVANGDFHVTIVEATGHERLRQFVALVRMSSEVVYMRLQNQGRRLSRSAGEHGAILDAIRARDEERAERLAREHVRNAAKHWLREET